MWERDTMTVHEAKENIINSILSELKKTDDLQEIKEKIRILKSL